MNMGGVKILVQLFNRLRGSSCQSRIPRRALHHAAIAASCKQESRIPTFSATPVKGRGLVPRQLRFVSFDKSGTGAVRGQGDFFFRGRHPASFSLSFQLPSGTHWTVHRKRNCSLTAPRKSTKRNCDRQQQ
jgi:hypothetical protein